MRAAGLGAGNQQSRVTNRGERRSTPAAGMLTQPAGDAPVPILNRSIAGLLLFRVTAPSICSGTCGYRRGDGARTGRLLTARGRGKIDSAGPQVEDRSTELYHH